MVMEAVVQLQVLSLVDCSEKLPTGYMVGKVSDSLFSGEDV
jgi:hypothetical protein